MHEAVIVYYQGLLNTVSEHIGKLGNASIFVKKSLEEIPVFGLKDDFLNFYIQLDNEHISDIKYYFDGNSTTKVAIEILCRMVKGKTLDEVALIKEDAFPQFLGCRDELLQEKANILLEFLNEGTLSYKTQTE